MTDNRSNYNINLAKPTKEMFDTTAETFAEKINVQNLNQASQIRKFYDELVMWHDRAKAKTNEEFDAMIPFIQMLNSKIAYAKGRKLVSDDFTVVMRDLIRQINTKETLKNAKLFFEATIGFKKSLEK